MCLNGEKGPIFMKDSQFSFFGTRIVKRFKKTKQGFSCDAKISCCFFANGSRFGAVFKIALKRRSIMRINEAFAQVRNVVTPKVGQGQQPVKSSSEVAKSDPYSLDVTVKPALVREHGPASHGCTVNATCEGCRGTDDCNHSHYCSTNNRCGNTDSC